MRNPDLVMSLTRKSGIMGAMHQRGLMVEVFSMRALVLIMMAAAFATSGCSGDTESSTQGQSNVPTGRSLTGLWRFGYYTGTRDDYSVLELNQSGTSVTGSQCQTTYAQVDAGDYVLLGAVCDDNSIAGTFNDPNFTLQMSWVENGQSYNTTFQGSINTDGRLSGSGHSTKCNCDFTFKAALHALGQPSPQL